MSGLSQEALDPHHDALSKSLAMLLEHVAAVEGACPFASFEAHARRDDPGS